MISYAILRKLKPLHTKVCYDTIDSPSIKVLYMQNYSSDISYTQNTIFKLRLEASIPHRVCQLVCLSVSLSVGLSVKKNLEA